MPNYRRLYKKGGMYFFTLITYKRKRLFLDEMARKTLKDVIIKTQNSKPFKVKAMCLMPEHLHTIWELPDNDHDYSIRWAAIKGLFIKEYKKTRPDLKHIKTFWQKRFWEHCIRNRDDFTQHLHYIHYNPVKHNLVEKAKDWPWSTFHKFEAEGYYAKGWDKDQPDWMDDIYRLGE